MLYRNLLKLMQERRLTLLVGITAAILLVFDIFLLTTGSATTSLDGLFLDGLFPLKGVCEPHPDIEIIGVCESSIGYAKTEAAQADDAAPELKLMGVSWPWDRRVFAGLIDRLAENGAKQIILDFALKSAFEGDAVLEQVLERHGDKVVLACVLRFEGPGLPDYFGPRDVFVKAGGGDVPGRVAFANLATEDARVRRSYLRETVPLPDGRETELMSMPALVARRLIPGLKFPGPNRGNLINFAGPGGTYRVTPIEAVFSKDGPGISFKDKIVIVGPYADVQFKDRHLTPVGIMPGPEIHANQLASLLEDDFIDEWPHWPHFIVSAFGAALMLLICFRTERVLRKVLYMAIVVASAVAISATAFPLVKLFLPISGVLLAVILCGGVTIVYDFMLEQRQRRRIHGMFGTYVSREVVDRMVESGDEPQLGGEECEITSFFSDIQGFTSIVEPLTPGCTVDLMNQYLSALTDALEARGGTLDKYVGDSIVAMFGAPVARVDHAAQACMAALEMQDAQAKLREKWAGEGDQWSKKCLSMRTRIGLNSGAATVGNMGSHKRFNYTCMGDTVNLASRCESASGAYGVYIMVTEPTRRLALRDNDELIFRPIDRLIVKGRSVPEDVHELMGLAASLTAQARECLAMWTEAMALYLEQDWQSAADGFAASRLLEPNLPERNPGVPTTPSDVMIKRCEAYLISPPDSDWDGVFIMKSKK